MQEKNNPYSVRLASESAKLIIFKEEIACQKLAEDMTSPTSYLTSEHQE